MSIQSTTAIAAQALRTEATRLANSAHNVANVGTDDFESHRIDAGSPVEQTAENAGAIEATTSPAGGPLASGDTQSVVRASDTDIATERVVQMQALASFRANMRVIDTATEMQDSLLDIQA